MLHGFQSPQFEQTQELYLQELQVLVQLQAHSQIDHHPCLQLRSFRRRRLRWEYRLGEVPYL